MPRHATRLSHISICPIRVRSLCPRLASKTATFQNNGNARKLLAPKARATGGLAKVLANIKQSKQLICCCPRHLRPVVAWLCFLPQQTNNCSLHHRSSPAQALTQQFSPRSTRRAAYRTVIRPRVNLTPYRPAMVFSFASRALLLWVATACIRLPAFQVVSAGNLQASDLYEHNISRMRRTPTTNARRAQPSTRPVYAILELPEPAYAECQELSPAGSSPSRFLSQTQFNCRYGPPGSTTCVYDIASGALVGESAQPGETCPLSSE